MESSIRKEGYQVPQVNLFTLSDNRDLVKSTAADLFNNKKVVVFSLTGAFSYVDGEEALLDILESSQDIIDLGVDKVYCLAVNDIWTLYNWGLSFNAHEYPIKFVSDGNAHFTSTMGYLVDKTEEGYGKRSWRYAMVVENGIIEKVFVEDGMTTEPSSDPYLQTRPDRVLEYLRS